MVQQFEAQVFLEGSSFWNIPWIYPPPPPQDAFSWQSEGLDWDFRGNVIPGSNWNPGSRGYIQLRPFSWINHPCFRQICVGSGWIQIPKLGGGFKYFWNVHPQIWWKMRRHVFQMGHCCRLRPGPAMLAIYPKPLRSYVPLESKLKQRLEEFEVTEGICLRIYCVCIHIYISY